MLPSATTPSDVSTAVPAASTLVTDDTLQVPVASNGNYSSDNLLGTITPSDVSSTNSPTMPPTTAAQPPDSVVDGFTLTTPNTPVASDVARVRIVPESLLLPVEDDDDDDEFIPRGNVSGPSAGVGKPPHKPIKDGVNK